MSMLSSLGPSSFIQSLGHVGEQKTNCSAHVVPLRLHAMTASVRRRRHRVHSARTIPGVLGQRGRRVAARVSAAGRTMFIERVLSGSDGKQVEALRKARLQVGVHRRVPHTPINAVRHVGVHARHIERLRARTQHGDPARPDVAVGLVGGAELCDNRLDLPLGVAVAAAVLHQLFVRTAGGMLLRPFDLICTDTDKIL
jgi:hypothetical protein